MSREKHNSDINEEINTPKQVNLWKTIGFHRPLGGFWFNYLLVLGVAVFAVLFMFWLLPNYILPFPDAIGFQDIVKNLFAVYFMLADVGVGRAIQRFVAEKNVTDPKRALQYLQFFIWFQMFTGLAQVTIIAVWAISIVRTTNLAYATWFLIIYSTIQYPGMLGVFHGTLSGFQRYDKANLLGFIQSVVLESSTRIVFILLGRWWGVMNPAIGELMGATIGSIIGAYIDDFIAALVAAHWTRPILKEINPSWGIKQMFGVDFDKKLIRECLWFGLKAILPSTFHQATQFIQMMLLINFLPNYAFIWGLFSLAEMISGAIGLAKFSMTATISEAYNNGKYKLVQYYQQRAYRWLGIMSSFMMIIIFLIAPLLGTIAGTQFVLAAPMIQLLVIGRYAEAPGSLNADIFMGANKPEYYLVTNAAEAISRNIFLYLLLVVFQLGWIALAMARILGWWFRWFTGIFLINRLFKFKINTWQTFIAPALAGLVELIVMGFFTNFLFPTISESIGIIPAAIIIIFATLILVPFFVFFPVYTFFGGWDEDGLEVFAQAVKISGPSKPIIFFVLKMARKIASI